jgi:hypothetical protein
MKLPNDYARCNGDSVANFISDVVNIEMAPLCTRCYRYLDRENYGPRTPFMQGVVIDGKCEHFVGEME